MNIKKFNKLAYDVRNNRNILTPRQKVVIAAMLGFSDDTDNLGQIVLYTGLKVDRKTGRTRLMGDRDFQEEENL